MEPDAAPASGVEGSLRTESGPSWCRWQPWGALACLGASVLSLALAPFLMPDSYAWMTHTTSESGAQGLSGAWLARLGFLTFGLGVLWLSSLAGRRWGRWGQFSHRVFGVMMLATGTFSHRPIDQEVVFDRTEDLLHSIAATAIGFAFAFGVLAVMLRRPELMLFRRIIDVTALAASIIIPLSMTAWSGSAGLLQRTMFLIAYLWYATEAWGTHHHTKADS